jgi:hypothetical protein
MVIRPQIIDFLRGMSRDIQKSVLVKIQEYGF